MWLNLEGRNRSFRPSLEGMGFEKENSYYLIIVNHDIESRERVGFENLL